MANPLHPSQTILDIDDYTIQIKLIRTFELVSQILSFVDHLEVIEPFVLRESIKRKKTALEKFLLCRLIAQQ